MPEDRAVQQVAAISKVLNRFVLAVNTFLLFSIAVTTATTTAAFGVSGLKSEMNAASQGLSLSTEEVPLLVQSDSTSTKLAFTNRSFPFTSVETSPGANVPELEVPASVRASERRKLAVFDDRKAKPSTSTIATDNNLERQRSAVPKSSAEIETTFKSSDDSSNSIPGEILTTSGGADNQVLGQVIPDSDTADDTLAATGFEQVLYVLIGIASFVLGALLLASLRLGRLL